jgi:hypothetical protein
MIQAFLFCHERSPVALVRDIGCEDPQRRVEHAGTEIYANAHL